MRGALWLLPWVLPVLGCASGSPAYVAVAASDRAAWFVQRVPGASRGDYVERVVQCHEDRAPPCVRFDVVGVRDRDWYLAWLRQSTHGAAPPGPAPASAPGPATPAAPAPAPPPPAWTP